MAHIPLPRYLDVLLLHHICKVSLAKTAEKLELAVGQSAVGSWQSAVTNRHCERSEATIINNEQSLLYKVWK